mgnify:CR=1 FL=1
MARSKIMYHRANRMRDYTSVPGIIGVEFDVHLTDGGAPQMVVYHDRVLPDGREVVSLTIGDMFSYEGIVVRLEEYIDVMTTSDLLLYIELKGANADLCERMIAFLQDRKVLTNNIIIASFSTEQIQAAYALRKQHNASFLIGYVIRNFLDEQSYGTETYDELPSVKMVEEELGFIPDILSADRQLLAAKEATETMLDWRKDGRGLAVWTVNKMEDAKRLYPQVDMLLTDEVEMMVEEFGDH